jgi:hypothetical protein
VERTFSVGRLLTFNANNERYFHMSNQNQGGQQNQGGKQSGQQGDHTQKGGQHSAKPGQQNQK